MEFVRRIYALTAEGDKTVRYIGQTENLTRRFKQHLDIDNQLTTPKTIWLAICKSNGIPVSVRTLEVVRAGSQRECKKLANKQELAWIRAATLRGIRLLNGRMWLSCEAPESVRESWHYFQTKIVREYRRIEREGEAARFGFMWRESGIIRQIEKDFPCLSVMNYRYKRIWQAPACM